MGREWDKIMMAEIIKCTWDVMNEFIDEVFPEREKDKFAIRAVIIEFLLAKNIICCLTEDSYEEFLNDFVSNIKERLKKKLDK